MIRRKDGSEFFASTGVGISPAIWSLTGRKYATAQKRLLREHKLKARVVKVMYADPIIIS